MTEIFGDIHLLIKTVILSENQFFGISISEKFEIQFIVKTYPVVSTSHILLYLIFDGVLPLTVLEVMP